MKPWHSFGRVDEFTAGYFDVVITDECHRSIYGAWQAALTRFDAVHIGLTATPAGCIERNTCDFYECEPGKPAGLQLRDPGRFPR